MDFRKGVISVIDSILVFVKKITQLIKELFDSIYGISSDSMTKFLIMIVASLNYCFRFNKSKIIVREQRKH